MKIRTLQLNNLRNHTESKIEFSPDFNLLIGKNGAGKTTILEAISICGLSKSFLPTVDKHLITNSKEGYYLKLEANRDNNVNYWLEINYKTGSKKSIRSNLGENLLPKNIIGEIPVVILSPDFKLITFGAPQDRRDFLDRMLSQLSRTYFENLLNYKKALKNKNALLMSSKRDRYFDYSQVEPWNEILFNLGTEIIFKRIQLIEEFRTYFKKYYREIIAEEDIDLVYAPHSIELAENISKEEIREQLSNYYTANRKIEGIKFSSCFGPHKDDLKFYINKGLARDYASQGQHKSLLISLKFSEFYYLKDKLDETPVVLFDDIFAELDKERSLQVLKLLENTNSQVFITSTGLDNFQNFSHRHKVFMIDSGLVQNA